MQRVSLSSAQGGLRCRPSNFFSCSGFLKSHRGTAITVILVGALFLLGTARSIAQAPTSSAPFTRGTMLNDVAANILSPEWQEAAADCRELTNAIGRLIERPEQRSLSNAREVWLKTSRSLGYLHCFQAGPIAERDFVPTFYFWQVIPQRMQNVLNSTQPIGPAQLEELGATVRGLFALEYMLFGSSTAQPNTAVKPALVLDGLKSDHAANYRAYLLALTEELATKAAIVANDWAKPSDSETIQKFAAHGQQSVDLLVNQLVACIEDVVEGHLHFVLLLPKPISGQLNRIERSRSGSSLEGVVASLEGAKHIFCGSNGLALKDAVRQLNPALEKRVADQFNTTLAATRAIGSPLEDAAVENRAALEAAYEKGRALEVLVKVDVVSTLGVTLTFSSNDGD